MGTSRHAKANPPYGSFGNTKVKHKNNHVKVNKQHAKVNNQHVKVNNQHAKVNDQHVKVNDRHVKVNNQHVKVNNEQVKAIDANDDEDDTTDDIDSGMSSEEIEDSLKSILSKVSNDLSSKQEVITKCLIEPQSPQCDNEIPSCSTDVNVNIIDEATEMESPQKVSEFIVIDLTCDVGVSESSRSEVADTSIDCDEPSESSVESLSLMPDVCDDPSISSAESLSLVPVANNEIVRRENQKLLSLSLSILLAALLQAMRCFAQFLEDIVIPHRL